MKRRSFIRSALGAFALTTGLARADLQLVEDLPPADGKVRDVMGGHSCAYSSAQPGHRGTWVEYQLDLYPDRFEMRRDGDLVREGRRVTRGAS